MIPTSVRRFFFCILPLAVCYNLSDNLYYGQQKYTNLKNGCEVRFVNENMTLCYLVPYGMNFGDELGPAATARILEERFGCPVALNSINLASGQKWSRKRHIRCLFTLGSIFHHVRPHDHVWGTGINDFWQKKKHYPKHLTVYSTRGPKTEELVREHIKMMQGTDIGHGDPGFLIPRLYPECRAQPTSTKNRVCFLPHAQDERLPDMKSNITSAASKFRQFEIQILSVVNHWPAVTRAIQNCDYLASASLHGLIVADALGVPSMWFQFAGTRTERTEGTFKYKDYLETVGRNISHPENEIANIFHPEKYNPVLSVEKRREVEDATLRTFPYHLFEVVPA